MLSAGIVHRGGSCVSPVSLSFTLFVGRVYLSLKVLAGRLVYRQDSDLVGPGLLGNQPN